MFATTQFQRIADKQLSFNGHRSLFYTLPDGNLTLKPAGATIDFLKHELHPFSRFLLHKKADGSVDGVLESLTHKVLNSFLQANQYLDFRHEDIRALKALYRASWDRLVELASSGKPFSDGEIDDFFQSHYKRLQSFLLHSNGAEIFAKYRANPTWTD